LGQSLLGSIPEIIAILVHGVQCVFEHFLDLVDL
jgi:hypothetical protein